MCTTVSIITESKIKIVALLQNKNDEYLVFKYDMDGNYNFRHCHYEVM